MCKADFALLLPLGNDAVVKPPKCICNMMHLRANCVHHSSRLNTRKAKVEIVYCAPPIVMAFKKENIQVEVFCPRKNDKMFAFMKDYC